MQWRMRGWERILIQRGKKVRKKIIKERKEEDWERGRRNIGKKIQKNKSGKKIRIQKEKRKDD